MSQLLWADAVFVRDYTKPSLYSDDQLLKAAMILYDTYNSHDLVLYLLQRYDDRQETDLSIDFAEAIEAFPNLPLTYMNAKTHV